MNSFVSLQNSYQCKSLPTDTPLAIGYRFFISYMNYKCVACFPNQFCKYMKEDGNILITTFDAMHIATVMRSQYIITKFCVKNMNNLLCRYQARSIVFESRRGRRGRGSQIYPKNLNEKKKNPTPQPPKSKFSVCKFTKNVCCEKKGGAPCPGPPDPPPPTNATCLSLSLKRQEVTAK